MSIRAISAPPTSLDAGGTPPAGTVVLFCGCFAIVACLLTLLGWFANLPILTNWGGSISMMPNAAAAGVAVGVGLLALRFAKRRLARIAGAGAGMIGALTLIQHLGGVNVGIDTLLLWHDWGQRATLSPGRMGPPAATSYTLLGLCIILASGQGPWRRRATSGGAIVMAIASLSLIGYAFGADPLFALPRLTAIAAQTATVILVLSIGLIAAVPEADPVRTLRGDTAASALVRRAVPLAVVIPLGMGWLRIFGQEEGLFDSAFGTALRSVLEAILIIGMLWWAAGAVRKHEEPLRESRKRLAEMAHDLRLITDSLPALVSYIDADLRYSFNNRTYEEWFGIAAADLRGKHMRDVLGPDALDRLRPYVEAALRGQRTQFEDQIPYRGGTRWIHADYVPDIRANGSVAGFYVLVNDISTHKAAEQALRESEARFRTMADAAPAMLWITDEAHQCTFLSRGWHEYTGQTEGDGLGEGWLEMVHPADLADVRRRFTGAVQERLSFAFDYRLRGADGSYRWVIDAARPRFDSSGAFLGYVGSVIDVHERKQAEEKLRQGAEALERSNRELERFVGIASHDLKEPLRGMALLASLIAEDEPALSPAGRNRLSRIAQLCSRLTLMVNGLLEYARSGGQRASEPCDLERIARSAIDKIEEHARTDGVEIKLRGPLPWIEGDPILLERMFANLIVNAIKHNHSQAKSVAISLEDAAICIRDNGPGIDPRYHERIFDLFKRVSSGSDSDGVGLGLALVRNIVRSHGGRIWVDSSPGNGAAFCIHFPQTIGVDHSRVLLDVPLPAPAAHVS